MAYNIYKCSTIGLAILVVVGFIWVTTPSYFWYGFTNNHHNLQGVPEAWTIRTFESGQQEAYYYTSKSGCDLHLGNYGVDDPPNSMNVTLSCDDEHPGTIHQNNGGYSPVNTEPAEFEFNRSLIDNCRVYAWYSTSKSYEQSEHIEFDLYCTTSSP